jgi:ribosome maturation factor RimP
MSTLDRVNELVAPLVDEAGFSIYDVEFNKGLLRITVLGPDASTDLGDMTRLARSISHLLDEVDPVAGKYTLEVSSPGLERTLRRPDHFAGAIGEKVSVKTNPGVEGDRRAQGVLSAADDDGLTVEVDGADDDEATVTRRYAYDDVARATTVFDWGPAEKPGSSRSRKKAAS